MKKKEFYQQALLRIASNNAFGSGRGGFVDYVSWAERIHEAAETLLYVAQKNSKFDDDEPDKPP